MDAEFWVALAFVVFVGVLFRLGAFGKLVSSLDERSSLIRKELEEAKALREEAQCVFQEYQRKFEAASHEADSIIERAKAEAERYKAEVEAEFDEFMIRRRAMAEKRIAQAEASAMAEVRSAATDAAVKASEVILRSALKGPKGEAYLAKGLDELRTKIN
jgi:F-type H+-transporting ATPase subunit b